MKMRPEHYNVLRDAIVKLDSDRPLALPSLRHFNAKYDKPEERTRWQLFFYVMSDSKPVGWNELYSYLDDNNIDTALRRIVKTIDYRELANEATTPRAIVDRCKPSTSACRPF